MHIVTEFVYPPIPTRQFDWCAVDDDTYSGAPSDPIGFGATEDEAVDALLDEIDPERTLSSGLIREALMVLCLPLFAVGICCFGEIARAAGWL